MRLPKYRRHSLRDIAYVEWHGQRTYLPGRWDSPESRDAYKLFVREIVLAAPPIGRLAEKPVDVSIAGLVARYLIHAQRHYPPTARGEFANLKGVLARFVARYGRLPAREFGPLKLVEYQRVLSNGGHAARGYVNWQINRVRRLFKWGVANELVQPAVLQSLCAVPSLRIGTVLARERVPKRPLRWRDVRPVIAAASRTIAAMIRIQWLTGVRSGSLCQACRRQFKRAGQLWEWRPKHKTQFRGKELIVPIGPRAQRVLRPLLRGGLDDPLFSPRAARPNRRYRPCYSSMSYAQAVRRTIARINAERKKCGEQPLPAWSPHQLRHARGRLVRKKWGLEAAQAVLGHDSIEATQIYAARQVSLAKQIALTSG